MLMSPDKLKTIVTSLKHELLPTSLSGLKVVSLSKKPEILTTPSDVTKKVLAFVDTKLVEGWLCLQHAVVLLPRDRQHIKDTDIILYGELFNQDTQQTQHLRENGQGGWILIELSDNEKGKEGEEYLVETVNLLGEKKPQGTGYPELKYRVYWQDTEQGYQQKMYRFVGFKDSNKFIDFSV